MNIVNQRIIENRSSFNEAEVRFYIIDPLLKKLGYPDNSDVYLKIEEKLTYPYYFIGHKSKKKDLPIGFPDYRAGLNARRGSFIVEAKSASVGISDADVEQAHSYAAHSQVGAQYFLLCDGNKVAVYETLSGAHSPPILEISIPEIDDRYHELENILSPSALEKNCRVSYDFGLKICDGLGSSVKFHSGEYLYDSFQVRLFINGHDQTEFLKRLSPQLSAIDSQLEAMQRDFDLRISNGFAGRDENGRLTARVNFPGVTKNNLKGMKLLGIDRLTFFSSEKFLSIDSENPTVFESNSDFNLERGAMVPPLIGPAVPIDVPIDGDVFVSARIYKKAKQILGKYRLLATYRVSVSSEVKLTMELDMIGSFSLNMENQT